MNEDTSQKTPLRPVKVIFHKLNDVPTYHADGAWGLTDQQDGVNLKFYLELPDAPKIITFPLTPEGNVSPEPDSMVGTDPSFYTVVREFQVGIALSLKAARQVHNVLKSFIELQEKQAVQNKP